MIQKIWHRIAGLKVANYRLQSLTCGESSKNREYLLSDIILHYHVLEKGLSMPERRYGFGVQNIIELCGLVSLFHNRFGDTSNQIEYAVQAILEYKNIHEKNNQRIDVKLVDAINSVLNLYPNVKETYQPSMSDLDFFKASDKTFLEFSHGRHSCRHFEGSVSEEDVIKAIELAQDTAPSACNRQSVKVKLISNKDLVEKVLSLQSGNRGFGNSFDKLIILTTDMSYWNYVTNIGGYVDGGIYLMNLLYSLYYYKIGACTLNSYFVNDKDAQARKLLNLPRTEEFIAIIGIGRVRDTVVLARSGRKDIKEILKIY